MCPEAKLPKDAAGGANHFMYKLACDTTTSKFAQHIQSPDAADGF